MDRVSEPTELIYAPKSSWLPMFTALGLTLLVVGIFGGLLFTGWVYSVVGAITLLRAITLWIGDARAGYQSLPRRQTQTSAVLPPLPPRTD